MARILGGLGISHVPAIGEAIPRDRQRERDWRPVVDGIALVQGWRRRIRPDVVLLAYADHGLEEFLDERPAFAVGAAPVYRPAGRDQDLPAAPPYRGDPALSRHLIEHLLADAFDIGTCPEMRVDPAMVNALALIWPDFCPVRIIPIAVNTVRHELPTAARCLKLGRSIGAALEAWPEDIGVLVIGTGGLSPAPEGQRAGFINKEFDRLCLDRIVDDPDALTQWTIAELVEQAGSQGIELLNWLVMRGALTGSVTRVHRNHQIPIWNTASGLIVLDNNPTPRRRPVAA